MKNYTYNIQSQYVSETEEEQYSDESDIIDKKRTSGKKIFSLGYFSKLMNKKIYSDDFDISSEFELLKNRRRHHRGSLIECPISEDVESEN